MSTLHLVYSAASLEHCRLRAGEADAILLLDAATPACREPGLFASAAAMARYVLEDALDAHGIDRNTLDPRIRVIDYAGFVERAAAASRCLTWF